LKLVVTSIIDADVDRFISRTLNAMQTRLTIFFEKVTYKLSVTARYDYEADFLTNSGMLNSVNLVSPSRIFIF